MAAQYTLRHNISGRNFFHALVKRRISPNLRGSEVPKERGSLNLRGSLFFPLVVGFVLNKLWLSDKNERYGSVVPLYT